MLYFHQTQKDKAILIRQLKLMLLQIKYNPQTRNKYIDINHHYA